MRRFMLLSAALLAMCACAKIVEEDILSSEDRIPEGYRAVSVPIETEPATKAGTGEFTLASGEKVSVWCTDASNSSNTGFYNFTVKSNGTTVTVQGNIPSTASVGSVALYPASSNHSYSNWHYFFSVDRKKNYIGKSYVPAEIPMYGTKNSSGKFVFTPMAGAAKKVITGIPSSVSKVKVVFTAKNAKVSGTYSVYDGSNYSTWNPVYAQTDNEKQFIRYFDVVNGSVTLYIPYAQGTIWGNSNLTVYDYSNDSTGAVLYTDASVGDLAVTRGQINTQPSAFLSAFGVDWSAVTIANNPSCSYPAFKSMKVTADENYLYVLLAADPAAMGSGSHAYDNVLNIYLSDGSQANSSSWIWNTTATEVSAMGGWLRKNGAPYFSSWGGSNVSSNAFESDGTYYYEIRYSRSMHSLLSGNSLHVGAYMNNNYQRTDGTTASSYTHVGILPAPGGSMYWLSLTGTNNGGGGGGGTGTELVYKNYTESGSDIKNPERGLYKMVEYKYHKRDGGYTSATTSLTDDYDSSNTLVLTQFYLFDYVDSEHINSAGKEYIRSVLSNVRNSGKKAIVRISYNNEHPSSYHQEPMLDHIKKHISDLKTTFEQYEDVIYLVQAGFMGTYGEWYYTSYFGPSKGGVDYTIHSNNSVTGFENRRAVLKAMLDAIPDSRQIALRTPEYKQCYVHPSNVASWSELHEFGTDTLHRLSFYDDAFLYDSEDMGTFHKPWQKAMWEQQSAYLITGGEAPYSSTSPSQMEGYTYNNVRSAIFNRHISYLHHDTGHHEHPDSTSTDDGSLLMRHWHEQGWMPDIKKWLGYRLWMENLKITGTDFSVGSTISVRLKIHNSGAAPVINERPMKLVLIHNGTPVILKDYCGEIRSVKSGTTETFTFDVTMPQSAVSGDKLALWLPDKASGLRTRAEYSIRLANSDVTWSDGYNILYTF